MPPASLAFRTDLALLALGGSRIEQCGDHTVVRTPGNPTFWWGNYLLLADVPEPARSAEWVERHHACFPDARHTTLGFDVPHGELADLRWFTEHGFHAEASAVMTASALVAPTRANTDARYRPLRSDDDWAQSVELALLGYDEQHRESHRAFTTGWTSTNRGLVESGHGVWFGAFLDGRLVAQLGLLRAGDGLARFQSVETHPAHRRRGLATALVHRASEYGLGPLGARRLVMVADPEYFAIDLYRKLGYAVTESQLQVERG